jgi:hypothetical protein
MSSAGMVGKNFGEFVRNGPVFVKTVTVNPCDLTLNAKRRRKLNLKTVP